MHGQDKGPTRRDMIRATGAMTIASFIAAPANATAGEVSSAASSEANRDNAPVGKRIRGFQHFGLTVQNMNRAFEFYSDILGGTEIMRDGDFHGEAIHNTLLLNDEIEAIDQEIDPATIGVPDLRGGKQRLDVRFLQFDNMVLELLHYRQNTQPEGTGAAWAPAHTRRSPAYPRSLHLCFHLHDDVDFAKFIHDLEAESARRGMTNVRANRIVSFTTEEGRRTAPLNTMSNKITTGKSNGWALIYARGPEGEALEFVQTLNPVKRVFDTALEARQNSQNK
jgi:catechol 2,3-dioxygenase-like lactoylglutathione lyase family enzyme